MDRLSFNFILNAVKITVLVFVCTAYSAVADTYEDGMSAYQSKDYDRAVELWSKAELADDPRALYNLSRLYTKGKGVVEDQSKATELLNKAASLGHASAQFNLGLIYFKDRNIEENTDKAMKLWQQAAESGHDGAQHNIGMLLWQGSRVPEDRVTAMKWFKKALHGGNKQSAKFLYSLFQPMYADLTTLPESFSESKTVKDGSENGPYANYQQAHQAAQEGSYEQAFQLWSALAEQGHSESQYFLANLYEEGNGVLPSLEKALHWYEKAAKSGQADAQFRLGLYHINEAPDKNSTLGLYWIQSAADNKLAEAIKYLENKG